MDALGENLTCTASNIVVRRSTVDEVGGFDSTLGHAEDQEFIARILATTTWRVSGLPDELVHYRTSVGGLSTDLARMEDGWQAMLRTLRIMAPARIDAADELVRRGDAVRLVGPSAPVQRVPRGPDQAPQHVGHPGP